MSGLRGGRPAEPFFMKMKNGERFCLYHAPHDTQACRGALLYVHPFGEEMNKSRRMAALQARSFAGAGFAVLQIDLLGCGDSSGDFNDAGWQAWRDDLDAAAGWLEQRTSQPVMLWGLRLGALLAIDVAAASGGRFTELILWQPVTSGKAVLTQFLRLRMAGELLAGGAARPSGTREIRARIAQGERIDVAGYALNPALAASLDRLAAADLAVPGATVHWFELMADTGSALPPATAQVMAAWEQHGMAVHRHTVTGPPFWAAHEIVECPALLAATTDVYSEVPS
jgi:exosortase A-associated hydrolase 2